MNIYVASSWRNPFQPHVVRALIGLGHSVYDFREPRPGAKGFGWSEVDPGWRTWTFEEYRAALAHPVAERGYGFDIGALDACEACVLVLPCGRSAHLELGYACGQGKRTAVLFPRGFEGAPGVPDVEPELMNKMADAILLDAGELAAWVGKVGG